MYSLLLNPGILFALLWSLFIILYELRLSSLLLPMDTNSLIFFSSSCVVFLIPTFLRNLTKRKKQKFLNHNSFNLKLNVNIKPVVFLFIVITVIELAIFKNLPLLGAIGIGKYIRYTDYGIPTLHGLANSLLLVLSNYYFYNFLINQSRNKKEFLIFWIGLFLWTICLFSRQLIMSFLIQTLLIYIFYRRHIYLQTKPNKFKPGIKISYKKIKRYLILIIGFIGFIYLFSAIGNMRNQTEHSILDVAGGENFPSYLPTGLFWIYLYVTSPISNVINNLWKITPDYLPISVFSGFIPTKLWSLLDLDISSSYQWKLVVDFLNVSTFHQVFLQDFGPIVSIFVYLLLAFLFDKLYLASLKTESLAIRFVHIVLLHNIFLSVFVNYFTEAVFIGQMVIHLLLRPRFLFERKKPSFILLDKGLT